MRSCRYFSACTGFHRDDGRLHDLIDPLRRSTIESPIRRSVAQPGSASDLGSEGRRFESFRSDQRNQGVTCKACNPFFFVWRECAPFTSPRRRAPCVRSAKRGRHERSSREAAAAPEPRSPPALPRSPRRSIRRGSAAASEHALHCCCRKSAPSFRRRGSTRTVQPASPPSARAAHVAAIPAHRPTLVPSSQTLPDSPNVAAIPLSVSTRCRVAR